MLIIERCQDIHPMNINKFKHLPQQEGELLFSKVSTNQIAYRSAYSKHKMLNVELSQAIGVMKLKAKFHHRDLISTKVILYQSINNLIAYPGQKCSSSSNLNIKAKVRRRLIVIKSHG
ncbi:hypothetical protein SNE40_010042 [Patella caerulea]|uniref:Uncharacterized protein n=1 Tax=Patella caerulea TaxID=87958 RepID=A0AAN8JSJ1_PATCE